jgi:hypothetical protein
MSGTEAREYPIPVGYEDRRAGWKRAFQHAMEQNNSEKASIQYAEHHGDSFTAGEDVEPLAK